MVSAIDCPPSTLFSPLPLKGNISFSALEQASISKTMIRALRHAPRGSCVCWGIPFEVGDPVLVTTDPVSVKIGPVTAPWMVLMHTTDVRSADLPSHGFGTTPFQQLGEHVCDYVVLYADGVKERVAVKRRRQIGSFHCQWGDT